VEARPAAPTIAAITTSTRLSAATCSKARAPKRSSVPHSANDAASFASAFAADSTAYSGRCKRHSASNASAEPLAVSAKTR